MRINRLLDKPALAATILAASLTASFLTAAGWPISSSSPPPCERAIISENSGNGPTYHVTICYALRPLDDARWNLIVDGGPLTNGAIIIGEKVPVRERPVPVP